MLLQPNGIDVWYVDESSDANFVSMSAISIPMLRPSADGFRIVWEENFEKLRDLRRRISKIHRIPTKKELHAVTLTSGRGRYKDGKHQFGKAAGSGVYRWILSQLSFLQDSSIISVVGGPNAKLYGRTRLEAAMHALCQRMQRACEATKRNAMVFFDDGHGEYRTIYRQSRKSLMTGSQFGSWNPGHSRNIPMSNFFKDANFKRSLHSLFIQIADLIAFAALLKIRAQNNSLSPTQQQYGLGTAYDAIPLQVMNRNASKKCPYGFGIVWL